MKNAVFAIFILHLYSCGNSHLGMKYQQSIIKGNLDDSLYCYRLAWGLDAEGFVISTNRDVCQGFDSSRDICFGQGRAEIYYKVLGDTLRIFSNIIPKYPATFKYQVIVQQIHHDDYPRLDQEAKDEKIQEVIYNTIVNEIPCRALPSKSPYLIKFK